MSDNSEAEPQKNGETVNGDATDGNTPAPAQAGAKKNKKGKGKKGGGGGEAGAEGQAPLSAEQQEKLKKAMELLNLQAAGSVSLVSVKSIPVHNDWDMGVQVQPRMRRRQLRRVTSSGPRSPSRALTRSSPATSGSRPTWRWPR